MNALKAIEEAPKGWRSYYRPKFDEGRRNWVYFKLTSPSTGRITKLYKVHHIDIGKGLSSFKVFTKTGDGVAVAIYYGCDLVKNKAIAERKMTAVSKKVKELFPWIQIVEVKLTYGARSTTLRAAL